jgi:hypothetical protein
MVLSGGDLGGQELEGAFQIGDVLPMGELIYLVVSENMAVFAGQKE